MSDYILRLVELAKDAHQHAKQMRSLAKHFEDLAEQIYLGGMGEEKLLIGPQRQLVEDTLREIIPWQHEVVSCAQCVSEAERVAVLRVLKKLEDDDNATVAVTDRVIYGSYQLRQTYTPQKFHI